MKTRATITTIDHRDVDVDPWKIVSQLCSAIRVHHGMPHDSYINHKGVIETWENGHGSGFTYKHGEATAEQVRICKLLNDFAKEVDRAFSGKPAST